MEKGGEKRGSMTDWQIMLNGLYYMTLFIAEFMNGNLLSSELMSSFMKHLQGLHWLFFFCNHIWEAETSEGLALFKIHKRFIFIIVNKFMVIWKNKDVLDGIWAILANNWREWKENPHL